MHPALERTTSVLSRWRGFFATPAMETLSREAISSGTATNIEHTLLLPQGALRNVPALTREAVGFIMGIDRAMFRTSMRKTAAMELMNITVSSSHALSPEVVAAGKQVWGIFPPTMSGAASRGAIPEFANTPRGALKQRFFRHTSETLAHNETLQARFAIQQSTPPQEVSFLRPGLTARTTAAEIGSVPRTIGGMTRAPFQMWDAPPRTPMFLSPEGMKASRRMAFEGSRSFTILNKYGVSDVTYSGVGISGPVDMMTKDRLDKYFVPRLFPQASKMGMFDARVGDLIARDPKPIMQVLRPRPIPMQTIEAMGTIRRPVGLLEASGIHTTTAPKPWDSGYTHTVKWSQAAMLAQIAELKPSWGRAMTPAHEAAAGTLSKKPVARIMDRRAFAQEAAQPYVMSERGLYPEARYVGDIRRSGLSMLGSQKDDLIAKTAAADALEFRPKIPQALFEEPRFSPQAVESVGDAVTGGAWKDIVTPHGRAVQGPGRLHDGQMSALAGEGTGLGIRNIPAAGTPTDLEMVYAPHVHVDKLASMDVAGSEVRSTSGIHDLKLGIMREAPVSREERSALQLKQTMEASQGLENADARQFVNVLAEQADAQQRAALLRSQAEETAKVGYVPGETQRTMPSFQKVIRIEQADNFVPKRPVTRHRYADASVVLSPGAVLRTDYFEGKTLFQHDRVRDVLAKVYGHD